MKAAGITLSTVGAGGGANPFLEQLAKQGGGRFYAATNPASIPDIFLKETQQVSGQQIVEEPFFPILTSSSPILRGLDDGPAAAPRLQRDDGQVGGPDRARHGARRSAPRPVAVRAGAVGRLDVRLDRALGEGLGRLERLQPVLQPARQLDVPGRGDRRHRGDVRDDRRHDRAPRRERRAPTARRATSTRRARSSSGPDLEPRDGRPRPGRARASTRRRSARSSRARTRSGSRRRGRGRRRSGGRSGWSPRPRPSTACSAPTSRSSRRCGRRPAGRSIATPLDPWRHDLTATDRFTDLWPLLLVLALLLWPLDIALRRVSLGRRELAAARGWVARDRAAAPGRGPTHRDGRGPAGRERSGPDERCAGRDADALRPTPAAVARRGSDVRRSPGARARSGCAAGRRDSPDAGPDRPPAADRAAPRRRHRPKPPTRWPGSATPSAAPASAEPPSPRGSPTPTAPERRRW